MDRFSGRNRSASAIASKCFPKCASVMGPTTVAPGNEVISSKLHGKIPIRQSLRIASQIGQAPGPAAIGSGEQISGVGLLRFGLEDGSKALDRACIQICGLLIMPLVAGQ